MILNFLPVGLATQVERTRKKRRKRTLVNTTRPSRFFFFFFKYLASFFLDNFIFYFDKLSNHVRFFLLLRHVIFFFVKRHTRSAKMHIVIVSEFNCPNRYAHRRERIPPGALFCSTAHRTHEKKRENCLFAHATHHPTTHNSNFFFFAWWWKCRPKRCAVRCTFAFLFFFRLSLSPFYCVRPGFFFLYFYFYFFFFCKIFIIIIIFFGVVQKFRLAVFFFLPFKNFLFFFSSFFSSFKKTAKLNLNG